MTEREYERVKVRLNRYREMRGRVERLAEEAAHWNAMAELSVPEFRQSGGGRGGHRDMGAIKASALAIEEERDRLAEETMEIRQRLQASIAKVDSSTCRELLEQVYLMGSTPRQIADSLGISEKTVRRRLRRATGMLMDREADL